MNNKSSKEVARVAIYMASTLNREEEEKEKKNIKVWGLKQLLLI